MNPLELALIVLHSFLLTLIPGQKYTEGVVGQPASFLPTQAQSQGDQTVSALLFRGLFKYDIYGSLTTDLADTYSRSEDGLTYTVRLKDNQYWTNGKKITANDILYTSFNAPDLKYVATDKVDDLTVRYTLPNKYAPFLSLLTSGIMPSGSLEKADKLFPISGGDFRIGRIERDRGEVKQLTLISTRKDTKIKKMVFRYYHSEGDLPIAAQLGEIQGFAWDSSEIPEGLENFEDKKFPLQGIYYAVFFNLRNETLKELALRQKLLKVLPVKNLIDKYGITVEGPISRSPFTDAKLAFDSYDPTLRADLGATALTLTIPDTPNHRELARSLKQVWDAQLGLDVTIKKVSPEQIVKQVIQPRNFEILLYGQEVGRDPDRYALWYSAQKDVTESSLGLNITGFENVRADRSLEAGRSVVENEDRVVHYNELQRIIVENIPAVFLYHPFKHYYINKNIEGMGAKYTFSFADRFLDFSNWWLVEAL